MKNIAVSNSSAVIALARICYLDLLEKLFGKVFVLGAVWREMTVRGKPGSKKTMRASFIHVKKYIMKGLPCSSKTSLIAGGNRDSLMMILLDSRPCRVKRVGV